MIERLILSRHPMATFLVCHKTRPLNLGRCTKTTFSEESRFKEECLLLPYGKEASCSGEMLIGLWMDIRAKHEVSEQVSQPYHPGPIQGLPGLSVMIWPIAF